MSRSTHRRFLPAGVGAAIAVLALASCATSIDGSAAPPPPSTASSTAPTSPSPTPTFSPEREPSDEAEPQPVLDAVTEGDYCESRGATGEFADGSTAYCSRLQYSGATVWSHNADIAPNPQAMDSFFSEPPEIGGHCSADNVAGGAADPSGRQIVCNGEVWVPVDSAPQIGDPCIGADIGRTDTNAAGTAIICDDYEWTHDQGQQPSHPWVDGQVEWTECLEQHSTEDCREMLGSGG